VKYHYFNFFVALYKMHCVLINLPTSSKMWELLYRVPNTVVEIIIKWTLEFHRADAIQRVNAFRSIFHDNMKRICEDINMNTPIYKFAVCTQSSQIIYLNLFLPNCDPYLVRPHLVPESRIDGYKREPVLPTPSRCALISVTRAVPNLC
jgi:hypothetical protein